MESNEKPVRGMQPGSTSRHRGPPGVARTTVEAARGSDRDQAAPTHHAVSFGEGETGIGEMIEDVEDRDTFEGLVRERKRSGFPSNAPGQSPVEHRLRVVETDPGAVREVARELSLAAADVEHPGEALGDEAPGDQLMNVPCQRVAAKHRAREAHAGWVLVVVGGDGLGRLLVSLGVVGVVVRHDGFSFSFATTPGQPYNTPGREVLLRRILFGANDSIVSSHYPPVLLPSSTFRNYIHSEPRFRALLTEGGDRSVQLDRA
jgi:hypothetical protein